MCKQIDELRDQGFTVDVHHYRYIGTHLHSEHQLRLNGTARLAWPRGGMTIVDIWEGPHFVSSARADCAPTDNYNKAIGRNIALGRAKKLAGL